VIREIERNMQRAAAAPAAAVAAAAAAAMAMPAGIPAGYAMPPLAYQPLSAPPIPAAAITEADDPAEEEPAVGSNGGSLAAVAKAASIKAERAAIEQTLRQVHWNRRKAAQILGVSYKTLLNKIKECGISRA
jgi:DNA-binding NtrC family response regulator